MSLDLARAALRAAGVPSDGPVKAVKLGLSGDYVARVGWPLSCFIKIALKNRPELERELEAARSLWGKAVVPKVLWSGEVEGYLAMITETMPGVPASSLPKRDPEPGLARCLEALAALHAMPTADCPLDRSLDVVLAIARAKIDRGDADTAWFAEPWLNGDVEVIWRDLIALRPKAPEPVFTHGDACLPNFMVAPSGPVGLVDLGRAGLADRHQDLALFRRSSRFNFPDFDVDALIARAYPHPVDEAKMAFYLLLDEFF